MNGGRLLLVCPSMVGAGVERRVSLLVNRLVSRGRPLCLGLLRHEGEFLQEVPPEVIRLREFPRPVALCLGPLRVIPYLYQFIQALYQIRVYLDQDNPDVVVTFTLETTLPMYLLHLCRGRRMCCWVISEDSNTVVATRNYFGYGWMKNAACNLLGAAYRRADGVTCVSAAVENDVHRGYRVPLERLEVVHNPVDIDAVCRESRAEQPPYPSPFILAVGRMVRVKRFDRLIRALSEMERDHGLRLILLGEGPERERLRDLVNRLNLQDRVVMPGFSENPWACMAAARMLVVTSETEGFCNVIAEAMAVGCPVISTDCGGPADLIRHRENGILVEPECATLAQEMSALLESGRVPALVDRARRDVEKFHPEVIADRFTEMLQRFQEVR